MPSDIDVIQHITAEDSDTYSDDSLFSINSWGADLSFRELISRYEENDLEKPELQRNYVWDKNEASRFIDSLLLGLPVPSIFLAKTQNEKLLIIDGFQRINTVYDYVRGVFSRDSKSFKLTKTDKINKRWRGKAFVELTDAEQRRIKNTTIHAIIFNQLSPKDGNTSLYQIFERINTSGRTLLAQEIRNCVAQGSLNTLLIQLNEYKPWRDLFGLEIADPRMRDMEFILRFFALNSNEYHNGKTERLSLRKFLNEFMEKNKNPGDKKINEFKNLFYQSIDLIIQIFDKSAYHNISPSDPSKLVTKFSPTIFDSITIAASNAIKNKSYRLPKDPEQERRKLLGDTDFRFSITQETMSRTCINKRIKMAGQVLFGL